MLKWVLGGLFFGPLITLVLDCFLYELGLVLCFWTTEGTEWTELGLGVLVVCFFEPLKVLKGTGLVGWAGVDACGAYHEWARIFTNVIGWGWVFWLKIGVDNRFF